MADSNKVIAMKRLKQELKELTDDPITTCGVKVDKVDPSNIFEWKLTLNGPTNTPYNGGVFEMNIKFPENYPTGKPEIRAITEMYHCNIGTTTNNAHGHVCVSSTSNWNPEKSNMREVIWDIISLFYKQNPDDNMNSEASNLYKSNKNEFENKVREYVQKYAHN